MLKWAQKVKPVESKENPYWAEILMNPTASRGILSHAGEKQESSNCLPNNGLTQKFTILLAMAFLVEFLLSCPAPDREAAGLLVTLF